eukprot:849982-Alexandrium_andersonii.AAC.1
MLWFRGRQGGPPSVCPASQRFFQGVDGQGVMCLCSSCKRIAKLEWCATVALGTSDSEFQNPP